MLEEKWLKIVKEKVKSINDFIGGIHYTDWKNFESIFKKGFYENTQVTGITELKSALNVWISTGTEESKLKYEEKKSELVKNINSLRKDREILLQYLLNEIKNLLQEEPKSWTHKKEILRSDEKLFFEKLINKPKSILDNIGKIVEVISTLEGRRWHFGLYAPISTPAAYNIGFLIRKKFVKGKYPYETIIDRKTHEQLLGIIIFGGSTVFKYIKEKMFELTKDNPGNRVPIYGSKGELLWPI